MTQQETRTIRLSDGRVWVRQGDIEWQFARSAGPGGQHVNRTSSKAVLRFAVQSAGIMPDDIRSRLVANVSSRLTKDGELIISSQRFRDQSRNVADCVQKLTLLLEQASIEPKPRRKRRVSRSATAKRLAQKKHLSDKKRSRREPPG